MEARRVEVVARVRVRTQVRLGKDPSPWWAFLVVVGGVVTMLGTCGVFFFAAHACLLEMRCPPCSLAVVAQGFQKTTAIQTNQSKISKNKQVGTIQRQIGQVDEAVASFTDALSLDPDSSLALAGAGEAFLAQAHARTSEGLYTAAAQALRNGCAATRRFLSLETPPPTADGGGRGGIVAGGESAWKLLGDLYTYAHKLPPMCFEEEGGRQIARGGVVSGPGTKEAVLEQAVRAVLFTTAGYSAVDVVVVKRSAIRCLRGVLSALEMAGENGPVQLPNVLLVKNESLVAVAPIDCSTKFT